MIVRAAHKRSIKEYLGISSFTLAIAGGGKVPGDHVEVVIHRKDGTIRDSSRSSTAFLH
jgi:hypothetical protein